MARLADVLHMNVGCVEEPLSPAQKVWHARLKREHTAVLNEVEKLQKESVATKRVNSYMVEVKTKQSVKVKGTATSESYPDENEAQERPVVSSVLKKIAPTRVSPAPTVTPQATAPIVLAPANVARVIMVTNNTSATSNVVSSASVVTTPVVTSLAASVTPRPSVPPPEAPPVVTPNQRAVAPVEAIDKSHAALLVTVTPSKMLQPQALAKKREELDAFVKSKLVMTPRLFVEWLLQVGLLKSAQSAICKSHPSPTKQPLHLAISCEENRFPNSGGYVWIGTCCGDTFVSVFQGSIFEGTSLSPHTILKLMYHWCCQTPLKNVLQWVNVEKPFMDEFYSLLRSVCTVSLHSSMSKFGSSSSSYVEIGVISLGTTSADGKKRDVKVEVLGVYDRDTHKMILRASEPIAETGTARRRLRFARIFQNLPKWVSTDAILLTDTTVDTSVLNDLGFRIVIQKSAANNTQDQKFTNKTVMEYLRKTVPHAFINTLTILSLPTIQQFLDELVWRENWGFSSAGAFHSLLKDVSTQTRASGPDILTRLKKVAANPFEDWRLPDAKTQPTGVSLVTRTPQQVAQAAAAKRAAGPPTEAATPVKQSRVVTHFGTLPGTPKTTPTSNVSLKCQYSDCVQLLSNNLSTMQHLRYHAARDAGVDAALLKEQCRYCLEDFSTAPERNAHVHSKHIFTENIMKSADGYIENVVLKQETCVICTKSLSSRQRLDQHIRGCHVLAEMPYKCRVCNYRTSIHADLIQHFHEEHRRTAHLLCPVCLDTYVITGENSSGLSSAHMQYLAHIRAHLMVPEDSKQQCKNCVLTFLQADQLTHHMKLDHASQSANPEVRSFTYSYFNKMDGQRAGTSAKGPQRAGPLSSKPGYRPPPKARPKTKRKQGGKDPSDDTVVRRFTDLTLDPDISPELKCKECGESLVKEDHFVAYHCCPSCRFATCCRLAMMQHKEKAHQPDPAEEAKRMGGSVYLLSSTVYCGCGFSSENAGAVEKHLSDCSNGQLSFNAPST